MLRLAGDVQGRRILDAGCGSGPLAAALVARGAEVTGFDGSPAMLELARRRLGDSAQLRVHDLAQPLPYQSETFDDVVASLVLHYLKDWREPWPSFAACCGPAAGSSRWSPGKERIVAAATAAVVGD